jgi:hypothetical protein
MKALFKIINWNHFKERAWNGERYYKRVIKIKGLRTAIVEKYDGSRQTVRFFYTIKIFGRTFHI